MDGLTASNPLLSQCGLPWWKAQDQALCLEGYCCDGVVVFGVEEPRESKDQRQGQKRRSP